MSALGIDPAIAATTFLASKVLKKVTKKSSGGSSNSSTSTTATTAPASTAPLQKQGDTLYTEKSDVKRYNYQNDSYTGEQAPSINALFKKKRPLGQ